MLGAYIHGVVYLAVNATVVALWILSGQGSVQDAEQGLRSLEDARRLGFWPINVVVLWGCALVIHFGVAIARIPRRRRRRAHRQARADAKSQARSNGLTVAAAMAPHIPGPPGPQHPGRRPPGPARPSQRRRWVVVLFTDLVSSTPLNERMGDERWADALRDHRRFVRERIRRHGGAEVGTQGDGFLIRFDDPVRAVACATDLQQAAARRRSREAATPEIRMGLHAGEVVHDGDDDDLVGLVVNLASRVNHAAAPGEILVTEAVADHVPADVRLTDRGLHQLKGFDRPRHLLAVVWQSETTEPVDLREPAPHADEV